MMVPPEHIELPSGDIDNAAFDEKHKTHPPSSSSDKILVADYSSEVDGERLDGELDIEEKVGNENDIDGIQMDDDDDDDDTVKDEDEEDGEIEEGQRSEEEGEGEKEEEEMEENSNAVISKPPQLIVPTSHVTAISTVSEVVTVFLVWLGFCFVLLFF